MFVFWIKLAMLSGFFSLVCLMACEFISPTSHPKRYARAETGFKITGAVFCVALAVVIVLLPFPSIK